MGEVRRSRDERPEAGKFRVTERDQDLLRAVGRMKVASTEQLRKLFFADPSTASRRLSKLTALRLLTATVADLNRPNLYVLTEKGRDLLVELGIESADLHVARPVPRIDPHLMALNDLRLALTLASRSRSGVAVTRFVADHDLRRVDGTSPYIPDVLIEIEEEGAAPVHLVAEIDLGGERAAQFAPKIETTVTLARSGRAVWGLTWPWRPVVLVQTPSRLRTLAQAIVRGGGGELWIGGLLDRVLADPFGSVFATASMVEKTPAGSELTFPGRLVRPVAA
jgi:DNA-binding MarR family transcriptional regulator